MILRIIGVFCLGGVGIAGTSWLNIDKIMNPVSKEVVLSTDRSSLAFIPTQEVSERDYNVRLYFGKRRELLLTCEEVKSFGVQWVISTSEIVKSWNLLDSIDYSCNSRDNATVVSFPAPSFNPSTQYYLHLSTNNKAENKRDAKVHAVIQHKDGIGTHYLFMDKALLELLGGGLLLISLICFAIDFWKVCRSWVFSNQAMQEDAQA